MKDAGARWLAAIVLAAAAGGAAAQQPVIVYTSVDQEYSEVVLKEAEAALGVPVKAVYDAEASKTVGLERRLLAEKAAPKADVFWNSENLRTHRLAGQGVLVLPAAAMPSVPAGYRNPNYLGFGLRARVIVCHTKSVAPADCPARLEDLALPRWKGKAAIARPLFGATATHFAALHAKWGPERFTAFLQGLKRNEVQIVPGNADVRDAVADGRALVGVTDTDDALGALRRGQPIVQVFPDQQAEGAFAFYQTVAAVKGGPNPAGAARLVEYLSSDRVEQRLIELGAAQIPVRPDRPMAAEVGAARPKVWSVDPADLERSLDPSVELLRRHLL